MHAKPLHLPLALGAQQYLPAHVTRLLMDACRQDILETIPHELPDQLQRLSVILNAYVKAEQLK